MDTAWQRHEQAAYAHVLDGAGGVAGEAADGALPGLADRQRLEVGGRHGHHLILDALHQIQRCHPAQQAAWCKTASLRHHLAQLYHYSPGQ